MAVFREPGSPKSRGDSLRGTEEGRASALQPESGPLRSDASDGVTGASSSYHDVGAEDEGESEQAHLLSPSVEAGDGTDIALQDRSASVPSSRSHTAPLLTSGPSSLLPGQPRLPARTGRDQLQDQLSLAQRLAPAVTSTAEATIDFQSVLAEGPSGAASSTASGRPRAGSTSKMADIMVKSTGEARWCNKCGGPKPDRAHHCSTCGICVLRMDHHCPWLGGCIGLRNHKAFFLFLTYTAAACTYAGQESARALLKWINDEPGHSWNKTTIESMEGGGRVRLPSQRSSSGSTRPSRVGVQDRLRQIVGDPLQRSGPEQRWREDDELTKEERKALKKASQLNVYDVGTSSHYSRESDGFSYSINMRALEELDRITTKIRTGQESSALRNGSNMDSSDEEDSGRTTTDGHDEVSRNQKEGSFESGMTRSEQIRAAAHGRMPQPNSASTATEWESGHGHAEWGPAPRRDFVLYDVDSEEE
ncbi:palmitoyltransferase for Vac8p [Tilletia horrida]|nr:palmitoyltransferase for Vac8p [Tilletia horrida]